MKIKQTYYKIFLLILIFAVFISCGKEKISTPVIKGDKKPNIVLIIIDALRADKLGCYGFKDKISPEIDTLAGKGVLFEEVYAQCSWTRPSIGSLITSLYPRSIGIFKEKFDILDDKFLTMAEVLKKNGYYTMGFTANPNINSVFNFNQGFDFYADSNVVWKWMKPESGQVNTSSQYHLPRSRELFNAVINKAAKNSQKSVFVQINIMEVHSPFYVRDEYKDLYNHYDMKEPNKFYSSKKLLNLIRGTHAAVRQVSFDVGKFISKLKSISGWEDTLFIITSDHGQGLDDHPDVEGAVSHGNSLYKSQVKVPLIFYNASWPKSMDIAPKKVNSPVRLLDLMPTILDYVNIPLPKNIHGKSLLQLLNGKKLGFDEPQHFFVETSWRKVNRLGVYSGQWEYFENRDRLKGVNPRELQLISEIENGKKTDKKKDAPKIAQKMAELLKIWKKKFSKKKRTHSIKNPTKREIKQLKSLGYLN